MLRLLSINKRFIKIINYTHALRILEIEDTYMPSESEIKAAYRAASLKWHPDTNVHLKSIQEQYSNMGMDKEESKKEPNDPSPPEPDKTDVDYEKKFLEIRQAYEYAIKNMNKNFKYSNFNKQSSSKFARHTYSRDAIDFQVHKTYIPKSQREAFTRRFTDPKPEPLQPQRAIFDQSDRQAAYLNSLGKRYSDKKSTPLGQSGRTAAPAWSHPASVQTEDKSQRKRFMPVDMEMTGRSEQSKHHPNYKKDEDFGIKSTYGMNENIGYKRYSRRQIDYQGANVDLYDHRQIKNDPTAKSAKDRYRQEDPFEGLVDSDGNINYEFKKREVFQDWDDVDEQTSDYSSETGKRTQVEEEEDI